MDDSEQKPLLTLSPSFRDESRNIAGDNHDSGDESDGGDDFGFEFEFSIGSPSAASGDPADEIFADGRILPVYPVFNRSLLGSDPDAIPDPKSLRSGSASSTSSAESIDIGAAAPPATSDAAVAAGSYCPWSPDRAACKKSSSAGSGSGSSKRWSMRELVGGKRSHSDGKEKMVNLNIRSGSGEKAGANPNANPKPKGLGKGEMDLVTAHRLFYGKDKAAAEKGGGKKSFLPYKPELVGLFANSRAHHHHPFNF